MARKTITEWRPGTSESFGRRRIYKLARALDVKSGAILQYLAQIGVNKKSHSSYIPLSVVVKVREHFRAMRTGTGA